MNTQCLIKNTSDLMSFENKFSINNDQTNENASKKTSTLNDDNVIYETKMRIIDILQVNLAKMKYENFLIIKFQYF
jgi:hypothetical protein